MATRADAIPARRRDVITANDRLKARFNTILAGCITVAALAHFAAISFFPKLSVADYSILTRAMEAVEIPPQVDIPPPPRDIARPAIPVLATRLDIADNVTIQEVTFDANPISNLPPPPSERQVELSEQPAFTPRTVEPRLPADQRAAMRRYLERNYPTTLLAAGIGARTVLWVFINEDGAVRNTRVVESSGYEAFDQVAQDAVRTVTFSPAWNRDVKVPVWVQLPVSWGVAASE
jgi:TonB family protein